MGKVDYNKLYQTFEPNLEELRKHGKEYGRPEIRLGYAYGDRGPVYWRGTADIIYQVNVNPTGEYQDGDAYGGHLKCKLDQVKSAAAVIAKAGAKAYTLAPNEHDEYKSLLVGLRALGYRRAILSNGSSEVVSTW